MMNRVIAGVKQLFGRGKPPIPSLASCSEEYRIGRLRKAGIRTDESTFKLIELGALNPLRLRGTTLARIFDDTLADLHWPLDESRPLHGRGHFVGKLTSRQVTNIFPRYTSPSSLIPEDFRMERYADLLEYCADLCVPERTRFDQIQLDFDYLNEIVRLAFLELSRAFVEYVDSQKADVRFLNLMDDFSSVREVMIPKCMQLLSKLDALPYDAEIEDRKTYLTRDIYRLIRELNKSTGEIVEDVIRETIPGNMLMIVNGTKPERDLAMLKIEVTATLRQMFAH